MQYDSAEKREAYRRGAQDAFEFAVGYVPAPQMRALQEWLKDLEAWEVGDPPAAPHHWS